MRLFPGLTTLALLLSLPTGARPLAAQIPEAHLDSLGSVGILRAAVRTTPGDLGRMATAPLRHPRTTAVVGAGLLGLVATDRETTAWLQRNVAEHLHYRGPDLVDSPVTRGADGWLLVGLGGLGLVSAATDHGRGQATAILGGKAITLSYVTSHLVLKPLTGRMRPDPDLSGPGPAEEDRTRDPWEFGHVSAPRLGTWDGASGFPSFHFTMFTAVARVVDGVYDAPWVAYPLAAIGLGADFRSHNHWTSDMVGGVLLGLAIGNTVLDDVRPRAAGEGERRVTLVPAVGPMGEPGVGVRLAF